MRSIRLLFGLALISVCSMAIADDSVNAQQIASQGLSRGVAPCSSCHGPAGLGNTAGGFPRLAGLGETYLREQLDAFAAGQRHNPIMMPMARALTSEQRAALARYYSLMPAHVTSKSAEPTEISPAVTGVGATLARHGRWNDQLPACEQCHGHNGVGVGDRFPALAGQPAAYLASQLRAWQHKARPAGPMGLMGSVATQLSDSDIDAVSQYFASRPVVAERSERVEESAHE